MLQDLRHAFRLLRTQPGFSLVAILTLALGIGATTTLFTVLDATLLHPVSYPEPEQMVRPVQRTLNHDGTEGESSLRLSVDDVRAWKAVSGVFSHLAIQSLERRLFVLHDGAEPERLSLQEVAVVSEDYFGVLGVAPALGRTFRPSETNPGAPIAVVLSDTYWARRYGRDSDVIGRSIRFAGGNATIVGVMPPGTERNVLLWLSGPVGPELGISSAWGRLRSGVTIAEAERRLDELRGQLVQNGAPFEGRVGLKQRYGESFALLNVTLVRSLTGAVAAVLLIAAVNVAGMVLARGMTRRSEIAVRYSLGATTSRIARQLMTETVLLALAGGLAGLVVASWSFDALLVVFPDLIPSLAEPRLSGEVLAASAAITILAGLGVGLYPAVRLTRSRNAFLAQAHPGSGAERTRGGRWMVAAEASLAVVLLCVSGLLVRNISALAASDMGVDPTTFLSLDVEPVTDDDAARRGYYDALLEGIRAMPEVEAVGARYMLIAGMALWRSQVRSDDGSQDSASARAVSPGYLDALGVRPVLGRFPTDQDMAPGPPLAVINQVAAERLFPTGPVIGRAVTVQRVDYRVVAVIPDVRLEDPLRLSQSEIYTFHPDSAHRQVASVVVRPRGPVPQLPERLREAAMTQGMPAVVGPVRSGEAWIWEDASVEIRARYATLLSLFAGLGVLLAAVGIFGVTAYAVARRTREIGVRLALGSSPARAVREMLRETAVPMGVGIVAGLGGAALASKAIAHLLVGISPHDPLTYALVGVTFAAVAMLAAWLPARRAGRVDPVIALRAE